MNEAILQRTRLWTLASAGGLALLLGLLISPLFGMGLFVTSLWAVAGFWILEKLLRAALVPQGRPRRGFEVALWGAAKLALYGLAIWAVLAANFPPASILVGFSLLLAVLVVVGVASAPRRDRRPAARGEDV